MSIPSRNNTPDNVGRTYNDSYSTKRVAYRRNGNVERSTSLEKRLNHACSRSTVRPGVKYTVPNTSTTVRRATTYSRAVYDVTREPYYQTDIMYPASSYSSIETEVVCDSRVSDFRAAGGGLLDTYVISFDQDGVNACRTKALNKLQDQKMQLSVDLAEAKKTYNLLAETSTTLWKGLKYAKSGQWDRMVRELGLGYKDVYSGKASSKRLLEMQYGWMPLMGTIKGAWDLFSEQTQDKALLIRAKAGHFSPFEFSGSKPAFDLEAKGKRFYTCRIAATIDSSFSRTIARAGLANPFQLGWELVPFSFVLDWGIPIGSVLEGMTASLGLRFVDGSISLYGEAECKTTPKGRTTSTYVRTVSGGTGATHRWMTFQRTGLTSFPIPGIYAKPMPFTTAHSITALALFRGLFR